MRLLLESESVSKAQGLAAAAHKGQVDKAGEDYIKHPIAVAEQLYTEDEQTAALLHEIEACAEMAREMGKGEARRSCA